MVNILLEQKYLDEIILIIKRIYPKSVVWAYGSRVNGTAHEGSDLDLVIKEYGQDNTNLFDLREELNNSNIPFLIDIFELAKLPENFQIEIKKNYVVIYDGKLLEKF